MVFSVPQANPCVAILMGAALEHAGLPPADPFQPGSLFSLGKPGLLDDLFKAAGFRDIATTKLPAIATHFRRRRRRGDSGIRITRFTVTRGTEVGEEIMLRVVTFGAKLLAVAILVGSFVAGS